MNYLIEIDYGGLSMNKFKVIAKYQLTNQVELLHETGFIYFLNLSASTELNMYYVGQNIELNLN